MKFVRILSAVILCAGLWCIGHASAYWQSRDSNYNKSVSGGGTNNLSADGTASNGGNNIASCAMTLSTSKSNDVLYAIMASNFYDATIADTSLLTWSSSRLHFGSLGNFWIQTWTAIAPSALVADVITVTSSGGVANYLNCGVLAINGANTSSPYDPNGSLPATNGSGAAQYSTTNSFTVGVAIETGNFPPNKTGAGWTAIGGSGITNSTFQYKINSAPQTNVTPTFADVPVFGATDAVTQ